MILFTLNRQKITSKDKNLEIFNNFTLAIMVILIIDKYVGYPKLLAINVLFPLLIWLESLLSSPKDLWKPTMLTLLFSFFFILSILRFLGILLTDGLLCIKASLSYNRSFELKIDFKHYLLRL